MAKTDAEYRRFLRGNEPINLLFEATYTMPYQGIKNAFGASSTLATDMRATLVNTPDDQPITLIWRGDVDSLEDKKVHMVVGSASKRLSVGWSVGGNLWATLDDGTTSVDGSLGTPLLTTGEHVLAWVLDRMAGTVTGYVDGAAAGTVLDVSTVTGDLDESSQLYFGEQVVDSYTYDLVLWYDRLQASQIAAYGADYAAIPAHGLQGRWRSKTGYQWEAPGYADARSHSRVVDSGPYHQDAIATDPNIGNPDMYFQAADDGGQQSLYLSTAAYQSGSGDTPASQPYRGRIIAAPDYAQQLPDGFLGVSKTTLGSIRLNNRDGALNYLLEADWSTDSAFTLLMGHPGWDRSDYRVKLAGVIADATATADEIILVLRDTLQRMYGEVVKGPLIYGRVGVMAPYHLGSDVYHVSAESISATSTVWDDGVSVSFTDDPTNAGGARFTTTATPTGHVTCESLSLTDQVGEVVRDLLENWTPIVTADIDTTAMAVSSDYDLSIVVDTNGEMAVDAAVQRAAFSALWCIYTGRDGKITGRSLNHNSANVADYGPNDILDVRQLSNHYPGGDYTVKWNPNWGPTQTEVAKSVTGRDELRQLLPYTTDEFSDGVKDQWTEAVDVEYELWVNEALPASVPRARLWFGEHRDLFHAPWQVWEVDLRYPAMGVDLLDWVTVCFEPYWSAPRAVLVLGVADKANNTTTLRVWVR